MKNPSCPSIYPYTWFIAILFLFNPEFSKTQNSTLQFDEKLYNSLEWRGIGPFRGGRSCAVAGVSGNPNLYYFGGTGGGVWKTTDGGRHWENISDRFFGGSIGAVAVSQYGSIGGVRETAVPVVVEELRHVEVGDTQDVGIEVVTDSGDC